MDPWNGLTWISATSRILIWVASNLQRSSENIKSSESVGYSRTSSEELRVDLRVAWSTPPKIWDAKTRGLALWEAVTELGHLINGSVSNLIIVTELGDLINGSVSNSIIVTELGDLINGSVSNSIIVTELGRWLCKQLNNSYWTRTVAVYATQYYMALHVQYLPLLHVPDNFIWTQSSWHGNPGMLS